MPLCATEKRGKEELTYLYSIKTYVLDLKL